MFEDISDSHPNAPVAAHHGPPFTVVRHPLIAPAGRPTHQVRGLDHGHDIVKAVPRNLGCQPVFTGCGCGLRDEFCGVGVDAA